MPEFRCATQPCDAIKHEAKGMCRLHYKRTRPRTPDKPVIRECVVCGTKVVRSPRANFIIGATCSNECRRLLTYGDRCELPPFHMARWYGKTCTWTPPTEPKAALPRFTSGRCADCDIWFIADTHGSPIAYCSDRCSTRVAKRRRRAREAEAIGDFTYAELIRLWNTFGKCCAYCDEPTNGQPDPDHVVPLSRGGRNDIANILPACRKCNADKSDLTLNEWVEDRAARHLRPVRTQFDPTDRRFWHLVPTEPTRAAWRHREAA